MILLKGSNGSNEKSKARLAIKYIWNKRIFTYVGSYQQATGSIQKLLAAK